MRIMRKLKADILVMALIAVIAILFFLISYFTGQLSDGKVIIIQDGMRIGSYSLKEDRTISVSGEEGYNLILINNGNVKVSDADCPDKLCIKQQTIERNGESIICLPHKLVVLIESEEESDLDAVTN